MICSCVSTILPFASAAEAISWPRSPCRRAASRSSEVSRLICTRFFCPQIANALEFLIDQRHLLGLGVLLGRQSGDLLVQLFDALLELIFLTEPCLAPQLEKLALARQRFLHVGIVDAIGEFLRHANRLGAITFGGEPRPARVQLSEAFGDDSQIGSGHRLIKANENVAGLDAIALAHAHLADDAAGRVLHFLDIGIDDQRALRDQRAGDLGSRGPAAKSYGEECDDGASHDDVPVDRRRGACPRRAGSSDASLFRHDFQGARRGARLR